MPSSSASSLAHLRKCGDAAERVVRDALDESDALVLAGLSTNLTLIDHHLYMSDVQGCDWGDTDGKVVEEDGKAVADCETARSISNLSPTDSLKRCGAEVSVKPHQLGGCHGGRLSPKTGEPVFSPSTCTCCIYRGMHVVSTASRVPPMNTPPSPASGASTRILEAILPALSLAKASVTGIGIPGVEPVINGVLELVTMISTMKANKEDLSKLERSLKAFIAIDASGASEDLKRQLNMLSLGPKRFFSSKEDKEKILDIQNSVASHIQEFTFYGNISIDKLVGDIVSKVGVVHANEILARVRCVPARYNAENTPEKCMDGTRVNIINDIITQLTSPPNSSRHLFMLSGSAGSGKSTIAKSVASILAEEKHILAASFFFSRDYADHKEIKLLPSTIARQLADYNADFRHLLVKFLDGDCTGILTAEPRLQFQQLVVELLVQMPPSPTPWIICLDALDECGKDRRQVFLRWLSDSITHMPTYVRFFLTGRPDVPSYLKLDILHSLMHEIILDQIDRSTVECDIHIYVE
ncbi:hypothetical protein B0H10DRAFT_2184299 [Mycena sp. CBHHK59/15]|nr:hypothetical protein B0H10DRAFT_2184299 [Mycena sp. CBHHK59/15]